MELLKKYFMRNLSEAATSAGERRFGWTIKQRREERREMAMFSVALLTTSLPQEWLWGNFVPKPGNCLPF